MIRLDSNIYVVVEYTLHDLWSLQLLLRLCASHMEVPDCNLVARLHKIMNWRA